MRPFANSKLNSIGLPVESVRITLTVSLSTTISSLQDIMRKDAGVDGDAQRISQLGWLLFFKIYSDLEVEAQIEDADYASPIPEGLRWSDWADQDILGKDAPTGDTLLEFVDTRLFPSLKQLDLDSLSGRTRERGALLRSVFEDAFNYMKNGTLLRQVINKLNSDIDFNQSRTRHLFGEIYELILKDLQGAGNAGEFYTPRPVTQFAVEMLAPRLGEIVMDPACGTGGFLSHAIQRLGPKVVTPSDLAVLKASIRGVEKKSLPHLLCVTNMMIHGIEVPSNIRHDNALSRPLRDYGASDQVDIVATNPPFVGMEEDGIENNFPRAYRTRETAHLFVALLVTILKPSGRAAIVLPDSFLFGEGVPQTLRQVLIADCNLHTIIRLPNGVFSPYTDIRTNVLFFDREGGTSEIWYYEIPPPKSGGKFTKTQPIDDSDFDPVRLWWNDRIDGPFSWRISRTEIEARPYCNLNIANPVQEDHELAFQHHKIRLRTEGDAATDRWREVSDHLDEMELLTPRISEFMADFDAIRRRIQLTSGFVEEVRLSLTELAVRGALRGANDPDDRAEPDVERMRKRSADEMPPSYGPPFDIPSHWEWTQVGQVIEFSIGKTPKTKEPTYWTGPEDESGIPFISISDMPRRGLVEKTVRAVSQLGVSSDMKRDPISSGALLMAFKLSVGKTSVCDLDRAYFNEAITAMKTEDDAFRDYLLWTLPVLARYGAKNPAVRGATLNRKSLQALWIPVPPEIEQQTLVDRLSQLCRLIEQYAVVHEQVRTTARDSFKLLIERSRAGS